MKKRFYKWIKVPPATETMIEVTKDYFSDGDEYINEENGWKKITTDYLEVEVNNEKKKSS